MITTLTPHIEILINIINLQISASLEYQQENVSLASTVWSTFFNQFTDQHDRGTFKFDQIMLQSGRAASLLPRWQQHGYHPFHV